MNCHLDFIDSDFEGLVQDNIQKTIVSYMKNSAANFVPVATKKIQLLCEGWLCQAKKEAAKGNFYADLSSFVVNTREESEHFYLDKSCVHLVINRFLEKTQSIKGELHFSKVDELNTLIPGLIPSAAFFSFRCYWLPENLIIRAPSRIYCLLIEEPDSNSLMHFQKAKDGQGTDFRIEDAEGFSVYFHKSYLGIHSAYFSTFFKSQHNFCEANQSVVQMNFSRKSIENMRHFIYIGDIDLASRESSTELLELMKLSHHFCMDRLHQYTIEMFFDYENQHYLDPIDIKEWISLGLIYENEKIVDTCLHAAEKWERVHQKKGEQGINWTSLAPRYYSQLLLQSASIQCEITAQKLKACIDALLPA